MSLSILEKVAKRKSSQKKDSNEEVEDNDEDPSDQPLPKKLKKGKAPRGYKDRPEKKDNDEGVFHGDVDGDEEVDEDAGDDDEQKVSPYIPNFRTSELRIFSQVITTS